MRVELSANSVDFVATKEGAASLGVALVALVLIVLMGGWQTTLGIAAGVGVFLAAAEALQHRVPARLVKRARLSAEMRSVRARLS